MPRTEGGVTIDAVVREYNHAGGTTALTFDTANGDSSQRVTYVGGLFIVDVQDLPAGVEDQVYAILNGSAWDAVNVHVAQVPFAAPVYREMRGTPPRIALMNNDEDKNKGNASILESYLRLAGICNDIYEVVTPNEIAGLSSDGSGTKIDPILGPKGPGYDFLWAPHWDATKNYDGSGGYAKADDIVKKIAEYLKSGKGVLGECASIETFEHSKEGHFLTDYGFGHNGGTMDGDDIIYNHVSVSYTQIGNVPPLFEPEGGHLHNWRPFQIGDDYKLDPKPTKNASYNPTVKRYTVDNTGWDYFVGGHAFGNTDYGYVVYLGGHKYAECKDDKDKDKDKEKVDPELNVHPIDIEFKEEPKEESFELHVAYDWKSVTHVESIAFSKDTLAVAGKVGMPLELDLTEASVNKKKLLNLIFRNTDTTDRITILGIGLFWNGGKKLKKQHVKKLTDRLIDFDHIKESPYDFQKPGVNPLDGTNWDAALIIAPENYIIEPVSGSSSGSGSGSDPPPVTTEFGCTANSGCETKNVAGVRYVLNTLFSIKYEVKSYEYVRSAPIVKHPWLYQGSFEHPSYSGHFRRYHVEAQEQNEDWDTALSDRIDEAKAGNASGRKVYTASYDDEPRGEMQS